MKKYLVSKFKTWIDNYLLQQSQNTYLERNKRSLESTVDYIESNMQNILSVGDRLSVHEFALDKISIKGLILEFGVYRGETINFIANSVSDKVYGFDSFEGLPEFWRDGFGKKAFQMNGLPEVKKNVVLVKGWFDESIPKFLHTVSKSEKISYLHIDSDLYSSALTIFNYLGNKIVPGTIIVFDEYFNYPGWQNDEYKAFQEFIAKSQLKYEYLTYNGKGEQVAVKIM